LYEWQQQEFEQCFVQHDPYGFFWGDPPPEHDENYETEQSESSSNVVVSPTQSSIIKHFQTVSTQISGIKQSSDYCLSPYTCFLRCCHPKMNGAQEICSRSHL
jgi:hypothetical protein